MAVYLNATLLTAGRLKSVATIIAVSLLIVSFSVLVFYLALRQLGRWLVVEDPLQRARAIVVLGGSYPLRAMQAAAIYHQGWAGEIWLTKYEQAEKIRVLASLGIEVTPEDALNREVLERLGVPSNAILVIEHTCIDTDTELRRVAEAWPRDHVEAIIVITSKSHSRRVKALWKSLAHAPITAIVRYAEGDPFRPGRWFLSTKDALAVSHEVFGLVNYWAGFPIRSR